MKICTPLSQLLPVKNVEGVLKAAALLKDKNLLINIVGGGDTKNLERLADDLKIIKQVKFWGSLPNDKARNILRSCDIFILNSLHEGMPHALIEALAEGVPVIATKIPAVIEVLTDKKDGLLVNINDPKDLARAIKEVNLHKRTLVKNGRQLYEDKFTWESHLRQLYNVFDEVTADS